MNMHIIGLHTDTCHHCHSSFQVAEAGAALHLHPGRTKNLHLVVHLLAETQLGHPGRTRLQLSLIRNLH